MRLFGKKKKDASEDYERTLDAKLKISTAGRDDTQADEQHHPYEPTPYTVLERLAESGYIHYDSHVIDYGCGKGRVGFFLHDRISCHVTGVEYDENIYRQAIGNKQHYAGKSGVVFAYARAETFPVKEENCFYFFNPFSVEILRAVLAEIIESYYENPREMRLFFYYPSDEYMGYLMTVPEVAFVDEIDCRDLFDGKDERERIVVFEIENWG